MPDPLQVGHSFAALSIFKLLPCLIPHYGQGEGKTSTGGEQGQAQAVHCEICRPDFGVPLEVCQMWPDSAGNESNAGQKLADEYCEAVSRLVPGRAANWCDPNYHLQRIHSAKQVLERAALDPAALIVLGVETQSTLMRHLHTSFAYQLLAKATCPLITIHGAKTAEMIFK